MVKYTKVSKPHLDEIYECVNYMKLYIDRTGFVYDPNDRGTFLTVLSETMKHNPNYSGLCLMYVEYVKATLDWLHYENLTLTQQIMDNTLDGYESE